MPEFNATQLAIWTRGVWSRKPLVPLGAVIHDTRQMTAGALYVAIPGERFDGHTFISDAVELGAAGVLCSTGRAVEGVPCLEVDDPLQALLDMSRGYRRELNGLITGITGSAGKTTVKDLITLMLSQRGSTASTPGNWNNHIGLPLSILGMQRSDDFGVFEVGMNRPGEIAPLSQVLNPLCGVITSIGLGHAGAFNSVEEIVQEKAELIRALPPEGVAVLDRDSSRYAFLASQTQARVVGCSLREHSDYFGQPNEDGRILVIEDRARGEMFDLPMPLPGTHMMRNVMQAVAVVREFGASVEEMKAGVETFAPSSMRWEEVPIGDRTVINDAYNANPLSMRSAIKAFAGLPGAGEKWLVLGAMREMGLHEEHSHRFVGSFLSKYAWDGLIAVGETAERIADAAEDAGAEIGKVFRAEDTTQAARILMETSSPDARIFLKASRGEKLETVLIEMQKF